MVSSLGAFIFIKSNASAAVFFPEVRRLSLKVLNHNQCDIYLKPVINDYDSNFACCHPSSPHRLLDVPRRDEVLEHFIYIIIINGIRESLKALQTFALQLYLCVSTLAAA